VINTTAIGDELRDHVIELLEARGVGIKREIRVDTKKIDVLACIEDDFDDRDIAIECKNLDRNLRQDEVTQIYAEHLSLLQTKQIDGIWIIARRDFSPDAKNWANAQLGLTLFSLAQFEEKQFGFKRFVQQVVELFQDQRLDQYYIPQRLSENELLINRIKTWIDGEDSRPVAILGGYGMGKTSFCKYLIYELGNEYLRDQSKRVPIYVRLSEIAKEQELDGLLGKMLASRYRLTNYNFQDVMSLNKRGKFVFIFDGFDEMKHALTWDLFKYNFSQINRAVQGDARVIIAGRPNAFLSDAEHSWALRGTRIAGDQKIKLPDWPEYQELSIQPFSKPEAQTFLRRYLAQDLLARSDTLDDSNKRWIESRVEEFDALAHQEDFARPVHLKIFADVATNRNLTLKEFSVYELYDLATQETIGREMEKVERLPISGEKRGKFLEDVAWWLWEKESGRALNFNPFEVPTGIVRQVLTAEQQATDEGLLRELFSGAFIERKFGDNFYFAHRSFLEFFVAKKLERASRENLPLGVVNATINEEILSFIKAGRNIRSFVDYVVQAMARYAGELKLLLLKEIVEWSVREHSTRLGQQHVDLIFKVLPLYDPADEQKALSTLITLINTDLPLRAQQGAVQERAENAFYFVLDAILFYLSKEAFRSAIEQVVDFLVSRTDFSFLRRSRQAGAVARNRVSRSNLFEYMLITFSNVSAASGRDGPLILIDFGRMFEDISESRRPKITVANRVTPIEAGQFVLSMPVALLKLAQADRELLVDVLRESSVF
jgi:hypothetical protein